jgi:hypothetical protein
MYNGSGDPVGIHLRRWSGYKFAVPGSRNGIFVPRALGTPVSRLFVTEGVSDTAALLSMGFAEAVGRPSCAGGRALLTQFVCRHQVREVVIVADSDEAGIRGAGDLAPTLAVYVPTIRVIKPPAGIKDVRLWLREGATADDVVQAIEATPRWQLPITLREVRHG